MQHDPCVYHGIRNTYIQRILVTRQVKVHDVLCDAGVVQQRAVGAIRATDPALVIRTKEKPIRIALQNMRSSAGR